MQSYLLDNTYSFTLFVCSPVFQCIFSNSATISAKAQPAGLLPSSGIGNYVSPFFLCNVIQSRQRAKRPCLPCFACIVPDDDRGIVEIRRSTGAPRWGRDLTNRRGDGKLKTTPTCTCLIQPRQRFFWKKHHWQKWI